MAGGALLGTGIQVDRNNDWLEEPRVEIAFSPPFFRRDKHGWFMQDVSLTGTMHLIQLLMSVIRAANCPIYDANGDPMWLPPEEEASE